MASFRLPFDGKSENITHNGMRFTAACFGKPHRWTLSPFQEPGDASKEPELAERIGQALYSVGATRVFATRPLYANARVIDQNRLNRHIPLPCGVELIRNGDIPADGTTLFPGDASAMSAGGCPRIVVVHDGKMADAHASRDSLIDRNCVLNGVPNSDREHETVVEALLKKVAGNGPYKDVYAWVFFSITARRFVHEHTHEKHGAYNRTLPLYVLKLWDMAARTSMDADETAMYLDVPLLIRAQFAQFGVPWTNVNLKHAYGSADRLYDTRGTDPQARNLVAIVRHA